MHQADDTPDRQPETSAQTASADGEAPAAAASDTETAPQPAPAAGTREHGGPRGLEPTRYGYWERNGRCYDF